METAERTKSEVVCICVGEPELVETAGRQVLTRIYKKRVEGPVSVSFHNLQGDRQADLTVHGGVDKAVYCYSSEHYPSWETELSCRLDYGTFGENLTVSGLLEDQVHIDDVLEIGSVLLQVSQPRFLCYKLGIKMGDRRFLRKFMVSGRCGFYCRVLQEGQIEAGQPIRLLERNPGSPGILSLFRE